MSNELPIIDIDLFKKKYSDNNLVFFNKLFVEAKTLYKNVIPILENRCKNGEKWFACVLAIRNIGEQMCFMRIQRMKINMNKANQSDLIILKKLINEILFTEFTFVKNPKKSESLVGRWLARMRFFSRN